MFYVVSYDIPDDRKRDRVSKTLLDFGTRVQYSVFECILDNKLLEKMTAKLSRIISDVGGARKEPNMAAVARCQHGSGREKPSINSTGDELIHKSKPVCKLILI